MAHPNKHIRKAIETAVAAGWRFEKAGPRAHVYGALYCPNDCLCIKRVFSTPRNPQKHAQWILSQVRKCPRTE